VRGKTTFLALVAGMIMLCATAVAFAHDELRIPGTKGSDELNMLGGDDKVYARGGDDTVDGGAGDDRIRGGRGDDALFGGDGDDRVKGGQDNDYLDGGDGDDVLNGRGDGDEDKIVCGDGYDVVKLGKGDVILVEAGAAEHPEGDEAEGEEPGEAGDDGCEKVKRPEKSCAATSSGCEEREACASNYGGCDERPVEKPCVATYDGCEDPPVETTEPDEPVEGLEPDTP
jgi:hypothetical protein